MMKYIYPDGEVCYRALHTVQAVYRDEENKLVSRVLTPEGDLKVFEITGFEVLQPGVVYQ